MSEKQPILIDANGPEYYAELLRNLNTFRLGNQHLPPDERPDPDTLGIQGDDSALSQRIQTLLDALADISLHERGKNVAATMASLTDNHGTPETKLYIVFNRELGDDGNHDCRRHLETIFHKLREVPYEPPVPATDGSPKTIAPSLETHLIELLKGIHGYSFDVFAHRVKKREGRLSEIWGYVEQTQHFEIEDRSKLVRFFRQVRGIILAVNHAQTLNELSESRIQMIHGIYSNWTNHNLLPDLDAAGDKLTLLDHLDKWLVDEHDVHIKIKRWAQKIMSFVISAIRLFTLTQSSRLRKLILGKFSVEFLPSPIAAPYSCILSSEAIRAVLNDALTGTLYLSKDFDADRELFIKTLKGRPDEVVSQFEPTVHAELAMVMAKVNGDITHVLPYIGVSKLSCIMCSHYIRAFNDSEVMGQTVTVRGSHGKAYPGWSWPILPNRDEELRAAFLTRIRQQLRRDFVHHADVHRRRSGSSVGSGEPEVESGLTDDDIEGMLNAEELLAEALQ